MSADNKTIAFRQNDKARFELTQFLSTPVGMAVLAILEGKTKIRPLGEASKHIDPSVARAYAFEQLTGRTEVVQALKDLQFPPHASTEGDPTPFKSPQLVAIQDEFTKAKAALEKNPHPAGIV